MNLLFTKHLRKSTLKGASQLHLKYPTTVSCKMTPILSCLDHSSIVIRPSQAPLHLHQSPTFTVPPSIQQHLDVAARHLRAGNTVAFPTETVYGLGAHSLDPVATRKVYKIKGRPADNPLIMHVSSLDMLKRLLPPTYEPSPLYTALMTAFWPGPLSLLFPSPNPAAPPAPQTNAIRMPSHPLALAMIHHADLPVSAPSANSSGRPSPTQAQHVYNDLDGAEGLGCILDGGDCGVGVESTVVDGLGWKSGGGGFVDVLRPGGLGVEEIARVVVEVDGGRLTEIRLHGRRWYPSSSKAFEGEAKSTQPGVPPSTPGLKYRHYSPRIPVFLLLPSNTFPRPTGSDLDSDPVSVIARLSKRIQKDGKLPKFGFLHYADSPLSQRLQERADKQIVSLSLGSDATSAAQRLFSGMLQLERQRSFSDSGQNEEVDVGVDAILIEGCSDEGLGLAVMERVGKAVGGGGASGGLDIGQVVGERGGGSANGKFWVQV